MEKPPAKRKAAAPPEGEAPEPTLELELARNRCPFCHEDVEVSASDWVSCGDCLARHHGACWNESPRCSSCGSERAFVAAETGARRAARTPILVVAGILVVLLGLRFVARTEAPPERPAAPPVAVEQPAPNLADPPQRELTGPALTLPAGEAPNLEDAWRYLEAGVHQRDNVGAEQDRGVKLLRKALALLPEGAEHEARRRAFREELVRAYRKRAEQAGFRGEWEASRADLLRALELLPLDAPQRAEIEQELDRLGGANR